MFLVAAPQTPARPPGVGRSSPDFFELGRDFVTAQLEKMVTRPTDAASRGGHHGGEVTNPAGAMRLSGGETQEVSVLCALKPGLGVGADG